MPSWPAGVQTTTIRFGKGITVGGNMTAADLVVEPIFSGTNAVIWDGDGTPLLPFSESVLANEGVLGSATVPVVDQAGWLDDGQNSYSLWGYKLVETPRYGRTPGRPRIKFVQPLAGQIEIDFDRIPDGSIGLPVSAPVVAVSSVNGQTGAVIVEGMTEDQTAELTAVTEAVEGRLSEAQLNAQIVEGMGDSVADPASPINKELGQNFARQVTASLSEGAMSPTFTKVNRSLFTRAQTPLTSLYWPWIIRVDDKITSAFGKFRIYYSTDHDLALGGGVSFAYADHPEGPWTQHPSIYRDTVEGNETETPSVMWNEVTSLFHMYYQQAGLSSGQGTILATSPDGITWTRVGQVIFTPQGVQGGLIHTGYFKPFRVGSTWGAYHLLGSGDMSYIGISWSADGILWKTDPRSLASSVHITRSNDRRVDWHGSSPIVYRGALWLLFGMSLFTSGVTVGAPVIAVAPLAENFRRLVGGAKQVLPTFATGETEDGCPTNLVSFEGSLWGCYRSNGANGSIALVKGSM